MRLVCLHNPWTEGEWTGAWSADSNEWIINPDVSYLSRLGRARKGQVVVVVFESVYEQIAFVREGGMGGEGARGQVAVVGQSGNERMAFVREGRRGSCGDLVESSGDVRISISFGWVGGHGVGG